MIRQVVHITTGCSISCIVNDVSTSCIHVSDSRLLQPGGQKVEFVFTVTLNQLLSQQEKLYFLCNMFQKILVFVSSISVDLKD